VECEAGSTGRMWVSFGWGSAPPLATELVLIHYMCQQDVADFFPTRSPHDALPRATSSAVLCHRTWRGYDVEHPRAAERSSGHVDMCPASHMNIESQSQYLSLDSRVHGQAQRT